LKWVIIRIPLDVAKTWGTGGRLKVKGEIKRLSIPHIALSQPQRRSHHDREQAHAGGSQSRAWHGRAVHSSARHEGAHRIHTCWAQAGVW
jgi:hypothetical protein